MSRSKTETSKLDKIISYVFTLLVGIALGYAWAWKALEGGMRC